MPPRDTSPHGPGVLARQGVSLLLTAALVCREVPPATRHLLLPSPLPKATLKLPEGLSLPTAPLLALLEEGEIGKIAGILLHLGTANLSFYETSTEIVSSGN